MAKLSIQVASTSQTVNIFVQNSSLTTGAGLTGLVFNTSSLIAYYVLPRASAAAITLATQTVTGAWSSGGFVEIDSTHCPGLYRLDLPDAALASGRFVTVMLSGATNMAPVLLEIELTGWNNQDATRGGLTALPNANAGASGGLPLSVDSSGRVDVLKINGTTQTARDLGLSVLLSSGTGTGQISLASGKVAIITADKTDIAGDVWDVTLSGHTTSGTTGAALNAASSAGDPWATALPGAYGAGTAGKIVGDNLNATVSSRLATSGYTAPDNADITAIKAKTDNLPAAPAAVSDIPTATANADALLKRDWSGLSGEASFSALNAFRFLRNKVDASSGTSEIIYKEDGSTTAWSQPITTSATANPIVKVG